VIFERWETECVTSENRFRGIFSKTLHNPTRLHMFGVTRASQELVQPPIYLPKPASDAVLSNLDWED